MGGRLLFKGGSNAYDAVFWGGYYSRGGLLNKGGVYSRKYSKCLNAHAQVEDRGCENAQGETESIMLPRAHIRVYHALKRVVAARTLTENFST